MTSLLAHLLVAALWAGLGSEALATGPLLAALVARLLLVTLASGPALLPATCLLAMLL